MKLHAGTSGFAFKEWKGSFYPDDLAQKRWLAYYATHFDTVEINNTFYRLPEASAIMVWKRSVPRRFLYAVKASRFLTHMKKLKDPEEPLERLYSRVRVLGHHLGPVLYQLPPHWSVDVERLTGFLATLPARQRHVIEFRDPSWYTDEVFDLLARHGVVCCTHDMPGSAPERRTVGPFVYARFHGPARYRGRYDDDFLGRWAAWFAERLREGQTVFAYFNNDVGGDAPRDALRLRHKVNQEME